MEFKAGMRLQHIVTKAVGVALRDSFMAGRNYGAQQIEYVDVAVTVEGRRLSRTWRAENVREVKDGLTT